MPSISDSLFWKIHWLPWQKVKDFSSVALGGIWKGHSSTVEASMPPWAPGLLCPLDKAPKSCPCLTLPSGSSRRQPHLSHCCFSAKLACIACLFSAACQLVCMKEVAANGLQGPSGTGAEVAGSWKAGDGAQVKDGLQAKRCS